MPQGVEHIVAEKNNGGEMVRSSLMPQGVEHRSGRFQPGNRCSNL